MPNAADRTTARLAELGGGYTAADTRVDVDGTRVADGRAAVQEPDGTVSDEGGEAVPGGTSAGTAEPAQPQQRLNLLAGYNYRSSSGVPYLTYPSTNTYRKSGASVAASNPNSISYAFRT